MKTFILTVECENADQLRQALEAAASEVNVNDTVDDWEVDEMFDLTFNGIKDITIGRTA